MYLQYTVFSHSPLVTAWSGSWTASLLTGKQNQLNLLEKCQVQIVNKNHWDSKTIMFIF